MSGRVPSLFDNNEKISLFPTLARTTTANGNSHDRIGEHGKAMALIDSAVGTGTTPTLDVSFEDSDDDTTFAAVAAALVGPVVQITDGGASFQAVELDLDGMRRFIRAVATIAGTTPSFTFSVSLVAAPRERAGGAAQVA